MFRNKIWEDCRCSLLLGEDFVGVRFEIWERILFFPHFWSNRTEVFLGNIAPGIEVSEAERRRYVPY
jgi:hypothetical protein